MAGRMQYARVRALIDALPTHCGQIVEMRKIDGLSQREISQRLGIWESVVENQIHRGIRIVLQTLREKDAVIGAMLALRIARP